MSHRICPRLTGIRGVTKTRPLPAHLPAPHPYPKSYAAVYRHLRSIESLNFVEGPWREIRVPPGLAARRVYELLPTAPNLEFGGYLTRTRIRFVHGGPTEVHLDHSKDCVFHTHPLANPYADGPSDTDMYRFLRYRNRRAITVGRSIIWVFDKTPATLQTVRRLNTWEDDHQIRAMCEVGPDAYPGTALSALGLRKTRSLRTFFQTWPQLLKETLQIKVTVFHKGQRPGSSS